MFAGVFSVVGGEWVSILCFFCCEIQKYGVLLWCFEVGRGSENLCQLKTPYTILLPKSTRKSTVLWSFFTVIFYVDGP